MVNYNPHPLGIRLPISALKSGFDCSKQFDFWFQVSLSLCKKPLPAIFFAPFLHPPLPFVRLIQGFCQSFIRFLIYHQRWNYHFPASLGGFVHFLDVHIFFFFFLKRWCLVFAAGLEQTIRTHCSTSNPILFIFPDSSPSSMMPLFFSCPPFDFLPLLILFSLRLLALDALVCRLF